MWGGQCFVIWNVALCGTKFGMNTYIQAKNKPGKINKVRINSKLSSSHCLLKSVIVQTACIV